MWGPDANINLQMNYWLAELTNLPQVTQPLWDYIEVKDAGDPLMAIPILIDYFL